MPEWGTSQDQRGVPRGGGCGIRAWDKIKGCVPGDCNLVDASVGHRPESKGNVPRIVYL